VKRLIQNLCSLVAGVLLLASISVAQVDVGDNVKLGLSGDLSTGYSGSYGSGVSNGSNHSLDFGGSGDLHGYYYNPQFLSFNVQPYYNRSQANSAFQSITDSSGVTGTANIFGGSHFPGSISFGKTYNTLGQFGLPGATGLSTKANGDTLEINWAAVFPNRPSLNVSYLLGGQDASVYGSDSDTHLHTRTLNIHSSYTIDGFLLNAFYTHQSIDANFPSITDPSGVTLNSSQQDGTNSSIGLLASHKIPLRGYWSANFTHSGYGSNTDGNGGIASSDGTSNSISSTASIQPVRNLGVSFGATYQTNLLGALQAQIVQIGGPSSLVNTDTSSKALTLRADSFYQVGPHLTLNGQWNHTQQFFNGKSITFTQYGGGVSSNYSHRLLGSLTFSAGAVDTATQQGNAGAGLYGNVDFSRKFYGWETGADFNYSQQVQTLGIIYTTSIYSYGGSLRKRFGDRLYWTNSARQTHSGFAQQPGSNSHSDSFSTTLVYRRYSGNAVYSQSGGASILTSQGLVPLPGGIPGPIVATPVLYNAKSYGGGVTVTVSRLSLTGSYSKAFSETTATAFARNDTSLVNALLRCRMRKLWFTAGYTRFGQNVGTIGTVGAVGAPPSMLNSYFFGISRWFNVF
jgi:hypothetical protein